MQIDIISYHDLSNPTTLQQLESVLQLKGIVGIEGVPEFEQKTLSYLQAVKQFMALPDNIKNSYAPNRDASETEGYELGAEWFKNKKGEWQRDDKKASFYAFVPDKPLNKWPKEVDLKSAYLELGELIFKTGKHVLKALGLDETIALNLDRLVGYGRMLYYYPENGTTNDNQSWCGAHFDHGILTGLVPAYYFKDKQKIEEPLGVGLYVQPHNEHDFVKIQVNDPSILLFQVGEFGQLLSNDRIRATRHYVKTAPPGIERITFALFYSAEHNHAVVSQSELIHDARYAMNAENGRMTYQKWEQASYERYRAR